MTAKTLIPIGRTEDGTQVRLALEDLIHVLFTASTGFGKTTALRLFLERTHGLLPQIVIDCEGELNTLRQEYDYVLIGPNGDRPLDPRAASVLPRHVMERGFSVIIDLSETPAKTRHEYVRDLYDGLRDLPRATWRDYLLVHDEAHRDLPEGGKLKERPVSVEAMTDGFSLFRKRGGHILAATQRLAKLAKDGAAECEAKIVGRCNLSDDRDRALRELGESSDKAMGQLIGRLAPGQVFLLGRAFGCERPTIAQLDEPKTKAPPRGKGPAPAPAPRAALLKILDELADLPQEAEKKARTEAELRIELAQARRDLAAAKKATPVQQVTRTEVKTIDRPVVSKHAVVAAEKATLKIRTEIERAHRGLRDVLDRADTTIQRLERDLAKVQAPDRPIPAGRAIIMRQDGRPPNPNGIALDARPAGINTPVVVEARASARLDGQTQDNALTNGQQRILDTLATLAARGIQPDRECLARWQGIHPNGGRFLDDLRAVRQRGLVHEDRLGLTNQGAAAARAGDTGFAAALTSIHEGTTRRILDTIAAAGPFESREALAAEMNLHPNGGRFLDGLRWLRQMKLIPERGRFELTPEAVA